MANWLERARCEIDRNTRQTTANSDKRTLMAVSAVPQPNKTGISESSIGSNGSTQGPVMSDSENATIRKWLEYIGENDPLIIVDVMDKCGTDTEARIYFLNRAKEMPKPQTFDDDRRYCSECTNLTPSGLCLAARNGEIKASQTFYPFDQIPRRCESYAPGPNDLDRRPGNERWNMFKQIGQNHADY